MGRAIAVASSVVVVVLGFFASGLVSADTVFPVSSLRPQVDGTCWAYGASHMIEARLQRRDGVDAAIDIQKSYLYWQLHDRLQNDVQTKTASSELMGVGGFAGDLFEILANHGFEVFHTEASPQPPSFAYPNVMDFILQPPTYGNEIANSDELTAFEKTLVSAPPTSANDAETKIDAALAADFHFDSPIAANTQWVDGSQIPVGQIFSKVLGSDVGAMGGAYTPYSFVMLTSYFLQDHPELDGKWLRYDDNRLWGIGVADMQKLLRLARLSMDRGWPVTFETPDHVMTGLGYQTLPAGQTSPYAYAVSDSSGAYFNAGVSWQTEDDVLKVLTDITVFYPALKDQLPAPGPVALFGHPARATEYPSIDLPRRH